MSRIGMIRELQELRKDVDTLKQVQTTLMDAIEEQVKLNNAFLDRLEALEAKRGRPKKDE